MFLRFCANLQIAGFKVFPQQLNMNTDCGKRIFDFMGDSRGKICQAGKVFEPPIIDFFAFPLGNIFYGDDGAAYFLFFDQR